MGENDNVFAPPKSDSPTPSKQERQRQIEKRTEDGKRRVFLALEGPMRGLYFDPLAVVANHEARFPNRYPSSYRLPYWLGGRLLMMPFPWEDFHPGWSDYVTSTYLERPRCRGWWIPRQLVYFSRHRERTMRKQEGR